MSKYTWNGTAIAYDLEDQGPVIGVDIAQLSDAIKLQALKLGLQTKLRNSTAGKMDEPAKGRKAMEECATKLLAGEWGVEATAAVALTAEEKNFVINQYLVEAKRTIGDKRPSEEIVASFNKLAEGDRLAILKKHEKNINKRLKSALSIKKGKGPKADDAY